MDNTKPTLSVTVLHVLDASTGQLHRRVLELLHLGTPRVVHGGAVSHLANGCDLDRCLVWNSIVPALFLGLGLGLVVLFRCRLGLGCRLLDLDLDLLRSRRLGHDLGLRRHLALVRDHLRRLLLHWGGVVQRIGGGLGCRRVRVKAFLGARATARGGGETAWAALDAGGHARVWGVRDLQWQTLNSLARHLVVLRLHGSLSGRVRVSVHGGDAGVALFGHVVRVLREAGGALEHVDSLLLLLLLCLVVRVHGLLGVLRHTLVLVVAARRHAVTVAVLLLDAEAVHLLAEVGEGGCAVDCLSMRSDHLDALGGPVHGAALGCRGRILAAGLRGAVVQLRRVDASLV